MIDRYEVFCEQHPEIATRIQGIVDRGRTLLENGQAQGAKKEFRRALTLHPFVPAALNNLALLAFGEGENEDARAYLEQLLDHDPSEPTACALIARYWLELGSVPQTYRYITTAVQAVCNLNAQESSSDASRLRRSLEFICQVLIRLGDDGLLVDLYTKTDQPEVLPSTLLHVGVAFYNRGDYDRAVALWRQVLSSTPDALPAQIYLDMHQVIQDHQLIAFRLDHRLEVPNPEEGQRLLLINVPTVVLATALVHLYRGSTTEVEEALPLLVSVGLPGIHHILLDLANDVTRSVRLRLLAGVQLAVGGDLDAACVVTTTISVERCAPAEEALWYLVQSLVAEAVPDPQQAHLMAKRGYQLLAGLDAEQKHQPFLQILKEIVTRNQLQEETASPSEHLHATRTKSAERTEEDNILDNWSDADWLRVALQRELPTTLEESLTHRPLEALADTAEWLGEQNADDMDHTTLIRRTAMRMRSLPLERVLGPLTAEGYQVLMRLIGSEVPVPLGELYGWLEEESPAIDMWGALDELYWASLIDIGRAVGATTPLEPDDMLVAPIVGLRERWELK